MDVYDTVSLLVGDVSDAGVMAGRSLIFGQ